MSRGNLAVGKSFDFASGGGFANDQKTFNLTQLMGGHHSGGSVSHTAKPSQRHLDALKAKFQPNKRLSPHEIKKLFSPLTLRNS